MLFQSNALQQSTGVGLDEQALHSHISIRKHPPQQRVGDKQGHRALIVMAVVVGFSVGVRDRIGMEGL